MSSGNTSIKFPTNIITAFIAVVMLFLLSCSGDEITTIPSFPDRATTPVLRTTDVITMISDSGITRYRISAPEWSIYDKAEEPYWDFPKGVLFERFDGDLKTDAKISSNEGIFLVDKKLWELTGNVEANNLEGEVFKTPKLFWSQSEERIYSPDSVTVIQIDKIIKGKGFESNQTMSVYSISNVSGIFPLKETE